ncbi:MAG: MarR family transcriptional regulator [Acidobacteria bacterium]|nr:MarR family transcriptional regulator [Acidobacteriota bacterium]
MPSDEVESVLIASSALLGVVARSLAPVLERISLPQFRVLVVLVRAGSLRHGALADRLAMAPPSVSRMLDRMQDQGWVTRVPNADSRREVLIEATDSGRALVDEVWRARRGELDVVLARISPSERAQVAAAFRRFSDAAGESGAVDALVLGG